MKSIRYRRGRENERDLAVYTRLMAEDNGSQLQQLRRNLAQALREEVTERQKQVLFLYYNQGLTMREIGAALGVDRSTVSRTIKRGEARLHRCAMAGRRCSEGLWGRREEKIFGTPLTNGFSGEDNTDTK